MSERCYSDRLDRAVALVTRAFRNQRRKGTKIHRDFRNVGDALWDRFTADRDQTLWYYRGVVRALGTGWSHPLLDELRTEVRDLHARVGVPYRDE